MLSIEGMRILLIEDEPRIQAFVARALEEEGFAVTVSADGGEALKLAVRESFELVVLDLLLPGLDGFDVLRRLAQVKPDLPVLILSARGELESRLRGFELGAADFLPKPFSVDELIARVRARLRGGQGNGSELVSSGALELDLTRRQARLRGTVSELSEREFRVLHHLASHAGEVVTREQLLAEVWGIGFDPGSNVVDVCIRRLRRKLGDDALIETVRHEGYRLDEKA